MPVLIQNKRGTEGGPQIVYLPSQMPINGSGVPLFNNGLFYVQYGSSVAYADATAETSILNNTASTAVGFYTQGSAAAYPASTLLLGQGMLSLGTTIYGRVCGVISNTSTPDLTIRWVLDNVPGTPTYTIATTGNVATTTTLSGSYFMSDFEMVVTATGTSGAILGWLNCWQGIAVNTLSAPAATTVDTTQPYTIDCLATWGTKSSSNTLTVNYAWIGVRG